MQFVDANAYVDTCTIRLSAGFLPFFQTYLIRIGGFDQFFKGIKKGSVNTISRDPARFEELKLELSADNFTVNPHITKWKMYRLSSIFWVCSRRLIY